MEINKTCLDCQLALWHSNDEKKGFGLCAWMFPFPLPKWLIGADLLEVHGYNVKRKIFKGQPHVECPVWEAQVEKEGL